MKSNWFGFTCLIFLNLVITALLFGFKGLFKTKPSMRDVPSPFLATITVSQSDINNSRCASEMNTVSEENNSQMDFFTRLSNLRYHCTLETLKPLKLPGLYVAKQNNLKYCKTPKSGSTFWMEVFIKLNNIPVSNVTKKQTRVQLHSIGWRFFQWTNLSTISSNDTLIMVARNPFSRLFSAYIDKFFLPGLWISHPKISKDKNVCDKSNTFSIFIDFIILSRNNGRELNEHWAPISELCMPCSIPYKYIIKQETFKRDVNFILKHIDITESNRKTFQTFLNRNNVKYSMEEFLKEQVAFYELTNKTCFPFKEFTRRLWKTFQIQGYISDTVSFPEEKFIGLNYTSITKMKDLFLNGISQYELSQAEKTRQRNEHLRNAYRTIDESALRKLMDIYEKDFRLLDYSFLPPHHRSI